MWDSFYKFYKSHSFRSVHASQHQPHTWSKKQLLTLKERDKIKKRFVLRISFPFFKNNGVSYVITCSFFIAVNHDNFGQVTVKCRQILENKNTKSFKKHHYSFDITRGTITV